MSCIIFYETTDKFENAQQSRLKSGANIIISIVIRRKESERKTWKEGVRQKFMDKGSAIQKMLKIENSDDGGSDK